jgi:hypothetical protein
MPEPKPVVPASPPLVPGEPEAVFIGGVPRSGTSLMRNILGKHPRIAIADENHYLGHMLPGQGVRHDVRRIGDLADDATIRRLVDFLYDELPKGSRLRPSSPYWRWLARKVPRTEMEARLLAAERSERGVFTAAMRAWSDRRRKAIFGEKTPAHIRHADELLAWYPTARFIHMIRDPRAAYRSEVKRRLEESTAFPYRHLVRVPLLLRAFCLFETSYAWADAVNRHRALARRHPDRYRIVRFEDLVREPEVQVRAVCAFLGVEFVPSMLEQRVVSKGDRVGETGFDAGAADRWRASVTPREAAWIGRLLGRRIGEMGYPRA